MMKIRAATMFAAFVTNHAGAATDIAGVQIGLPLATQKAIIAKANPSYELKDIKLSGKTVGINAIAEKEGRVIDQFVAIQNESGIVWFVARAQALEKGARIKSDTLLNSLKDKYGLYTEFGSVGPMWQFDRQGNIYKGQWVQGPCYAGIGAGASTTFGQVPGTSIQVPRNFTPKCGTEITTSVLKDSTDGMVSAFAVQIVDAKRMYDELNGKATAEEDQRKQKLEAEKSKDIKPKL